jgi:hypothetical protein
LKAGYTPNLFKDKLMDFNERNSMERDFAAAQAANLDDAKLTRFHRGRFTSKVSLFKGKSLILFSVVDGYPVEQTRITLDAASFDLDEGVTLHMNDGHRDFDVGYTPVEVAQSLFIWVPKFSTLERYMYDGVYHSKVGLAMRSQHAHFRLVEGSTYLVDQFTFANL